MYLKEEWVGIRTQLLHQSLLKPSEGLLLVFDWWVHLHGGQKEVLPEGEPQHVQVLTAITECRQNMSKYFSVF